MLSLPKKNENPTQPQYVTTKSSFFPSISFSIKFNDENFYYFQLQNFLTFNKNEQKVQFSV